MIKNGAVKIFDLRQNKEVIIPCHRHCDPYNILTALGYKRDVDYYEIEQGFLDEWNNFLDRQRAWQNAYRNGQIEYDFDHILFTDFLW